MITKVKTPKEQAAMRTAGHLLAAVLNKLASSLQVGMTTQDLADLAEKELKILGGKPAFLGYYGFPSVLCVSVNDEVVHGIPSPHRTINDGDIVSMDFGVVYEGMITDAALSVIAGKARAEDKKLVAATKQALMAGIEKVRPGVHIGDIGAAIQAVLDKNNYGIVRDFVGHGVGHELHEEPNIPNFGHKGEGPILQEGMTIAIEPMATLGSHDVYIERDQWTVRTRDHSRAAHFEHTVLVTPDGFEILTIT